MANDEGKWVAGASACPHSRDEICGPCKRAIKLRGEMSRERLTPHRD